MVGPPSQEVIRPDGSRAIIITRPDSLTWLEMEFDSQRRLISFRYDEF